MTERKTRTRKITAGREIEARKNYERQTRQWTRRELQPERENKPAFPARERKKAKQTGAQNRNPETEDRRSLLARETRPAEDWARRRGTKTEDHNWERENRWTKQKNLLAAEKRVSGELLQRCRQRTRRCNEWNVLAQAPIQSTCTPTLRPRWTEQGLAAAKTITSAAILRNRTEVRKMLHKDKKHKQLNQDLKEWFFYWSLNKIHIITDVTIIYLSFDYWNKKL
jgi:hypothetical protein